MNVIHDASSLPAVAFREPGADTARAALRNSLVSSVNWSEVLQKIAARQGDTTQLRQIFGGLGVSIIPFSAEHAERAATIYPETKAYGLSLGDRACLALGLETGREVFTADRSWLELTLDIKIQVICP